MVAFIPLLGLGASALSGLFRTGLGIFQTIKGSRMRPQRPTYEVSPRIAENLSFRQQRLMGRMAGAAQAEENLLQQQSSQLENIRQSATSGAQRIASGALSQAQTNRGMLNLAGQEAVDAERRVSALERANLNMAQEERSAWDYNERQRFEEEARTRAALIGGGLKNIAGGLGGLGAFGGQWTMMNMLSPGWQQQIGLGGGNQGQTNAPASGYSATNFVNSLGENQAPQLSELPAFNFRGDNTALGAALSNAIPVPPIGFGYNPMMQFSPLPKINPMIQ